MGDKKPMVFGYAKDISPPPIDSSKFIYDVHDGSIEDALEDAIRAAFLDFRGRCMEEALRMALRRMSSNTKDELSDGQ